MSTQPTAPASPELNPGDEAAPGTPGTGESLCPRCGGRGRVADAGGDADGTRPCPECDGTGRIVAGIGGA